MKSVNRLVAIWVILCLVGTVFPVQPIYAEASENNYQFIQVPVYNGNETKSFEVICYEGDFYFSAEDYSLLTKYSYSAGNQKIAYSLGDKTIIIDPEEEKMTIGVLNYSGKTGTVIRNGGKIYLSASILLPWLNVACNQVGYGLEIIPDGISLWEITNKLDYNSYLFNLNETMDNSVADVAGLCAMSIFDTLINIRWDRLVPVDGTVTGAMHGASLYDYKCYVSALSELGSYEFDYPEDLESAVEDLVNVNSGLNSYEELFDIDERQEIASIETSLREMGASDETLNQFFEESARWNTLREGLTSYEKISKYINVFSILKNVELTAQTSDDYRDFLVWLSNSEEDNTLLKLAATTATAYLDKNTGVFVSMLMNYSKKVLDEIPGNGFDAITKGVVDPTAISDCASFSGTFFGSAELYMGISKLFYSYVIPVSSGYEGMAKAGIIENIQDTCWSHARTLRSEAITAEKVMLIRQNLLTALQASKMNYKAHQDMMDVKILSLIPVFQSEGLLDSQIQKIEKAIMELIASSSNSINDSIEGKEEYCASLRALFAQLLDKIPKDDFQIGSLFGIWNFYSGGTWANNYSDLYGYHGYQLHFSMDGTISIFHYIMNSGVDESYEGTWEIINDTKHGILLRLNVTGGAPVLGEEFIPEAFSGDIQLALQDDSLIISLVSGELYGIAFEKSYKCEYKAEDWIKLQKEQLGALLSETEMIASLPEEITSIEVNSTISFGPVPFSVKDFTIIDRRTTAQEDEVKCTIQLVGNHLEITEKLLLTYSKADDGWELDRFERLDDEEIRVVEATDEMFGLALNDIGMDNGAGDYDAVFKRVSDYSSHIDGHSAVYTYDVYYDSGAKIQSGTISVLYTIHGTVENGLWWQGSCDLSQLSTSWTEQNPISAAFGDYRLTKRITNGEEQSLNNKKGLLSFNSNGTGTLTLTESYYDGGYMKQTTEFTWVQSGNTITLTYTTGQAYIGSTDYCAIDGNTITFDQYFKSLVFTGFFENDDVLVFQK